MTDTKEPIDNETGPLGQCVYTMSTGRRCQKDAQMVVAYGAVLQKPEDRPHYGYCTDHYFAVTKPRDPRLHKTAEPLTRIEQPS